MQTLNGINPQMNTSMRSEKAQGANVGDYGYDSAGVLWRWSGENWEREPDSRQSPEHRGPDYYIEQMRKQLEEQAAQMNKRVTDFETNNPFTFDEVQAEASAKERFNPYYQAELTDFLSGINRERQSVEGENKLLTELNRVQQGAERRNLDEAIRAAEEGYSGAGLYYSGARERATGMEEVKAMDTARQREAQFGTNMGQNALQLGDVATREQAGIRKNTAALKTDVETEVAKQKAEERSRWEYEKAQYVGYPYISRATGGLNELLNNAFQY